MSKMLSKMNLISVVQQLPKEDIETIQGYVEMIEEKNQELKEVIDKINHILNNQINYREFVDIVNAIEDVIKEVE